MKLSSLADHAVVLLAATARHCGGLARVNATSLAEETGVPLPTAQKLVSRLAAAGLVESTRGVGGGIRLSRPPAAITLADIVEAVEGPIALTACVEHGAHDCCREATCQVAPHWNAANVAVRAALAGVTLATLASAHQSSSPVRPELVEGRVTGAVLEARASTGSARTDFKVSA